MVSAYDGLHPWQFVQIELEQFVADTGFPVDLHSDLDKAEPSIEPGSCQVLGVVRDANRDEIAVRFAERLRPAVRASIRIARRSVL